IPATCLGSFTHGTNLVADAAGQFLRTEEVRPSLFATGTDGNPLGSGSPGSAGINSAPDLGGQRCGNHEDRGDSTGNRQLAEHLSLLGPNPPSIAGGADRPQSVQGGTPRAAAQGNFPTRCRNGPRSEQGVKVAVPR